MITSLHQQLLASRQLNSINSPAHILSTHSMARYNVNMVLFPPPFRRRISWRLWLAKANPSLVCSLAILYSVYVYDCICFKVCIYAYAYVYIIIRFVLFVCFFF